jgi:heat shock protein HslJ
MKPIMLPLAAIVIMGLIACAGEKRSTVRKPATQEEPKDSIEFFETDFKVKQKSYKKEMEGKWTVSTMRRQQKAELEQLSGVTIEFSTDSSFSGKAPCNRIGGVYTLKGTSIKFSRIFATRMACDKLEQESAFLKLLEETVSAYTVEGNKLLLRDGSSNIVFELKR